MKRAIDPMIDPAELPGPMIDICGTGGDGLSFFNVSTAAMFVVAAGGAVVAKHGNRRVTSSCGSADVLEELGIAIDLTPEQLRESLKRHGARFHFRAEISSGVSRAGGNARTSGSEKNANGFQFARAVAESCPTVATVDRRF